MITLLFFINIGDEDGPSFSYIIQYKKPPSPLVVVSNDMPDNLASSGKEKWYGVNQLDEIFNTYKIDYIYEIHNWYDNIDEKEAKEIEIRLLAKHQLPKNTKLKYDLVTYNVYAHYPKKYMIPLNKRIKYDEKVKPPQKYFVEGLYSDIFSEYDIINHHVFILDIMCDDDDDCEDDEDE